MYGNEDFEGDEIAKEVARKIDSEDFEFFYSNSPNDVLNAKGEFIIMDAVKGIDDVKVLDDIDDLVHCHTLSCHDLDLGFYLKMMKEVGKIEKVTIIGLPFGRKDYEKIKEKVESILENI